MGFKSDWEFLRNITVGAVGTRQVVRLLNAGGFQMIATDRSATSSKVWATKVKRLRVPDLVCLRSGVRVECRAKGDLAIKMSHATTNLERAWDNGLRDQDLVAFIRCFPEGDVRWRASGHLALFRVADLRARRVLAKESRMKAASEGSEVYLEWPSIVPRSPGTVEDVADDRIVTRLDAGRKQSYGLARRGGERLVAHVRIGDRFGAGERIIASVLPAMVDPITSPRMTGSPQQFASRFNCRLNAPSKVWSMNCGEQRAFAGTGSCTCSRCWVAAPARRWFGRAPRTCCRNSDFSGSTTPRTGRTGLISQIASNF